MNITARRPDETVAILQADFINCWIPLQQATLAAPAASVTFASIPQNFRGLALFAQMRSGVAATNDTAYWRANGDAGNNYDRQQLLAQNSAVSTATAIAGTATFLGTTDAANSRANCFGGGLIYWPNYRSGAMEKLSLAWTYSEGTPTNATMIMLSACGIWRSLAAITSLTFILGSGNNFVANSVFQLYGVL